MSASDFGPWTLDFGPAAIPDSRPIPHRPFRQRISRELRTKDRLRAQSTVAAINQQGKLPLSFMLAAGEQLTLAIFQWSRERRF